MPLRRTPRLSPVLCLLIVALLWASASPAIAHGHGGPIAAPAKQQQKTTHTTKKQAGKACRRGALDVRTGDQRRCVRLERVARAADPQAPLHDLAALMTDVVSPAAGMLAGGAFASFAPALADGSLERALGQAMTVSAGAARPRGAMSAVPGTNGSTDGWETSTTGSRYVPGENEVGSGYEELTEGTKDVLGAGQLVGEGSMRVSKRVTLTPCPDARGVVTGNADAGWVAKAGVSAPGHERFVVTDEMAGTAAVTARVADDAKLRDYDLEVKFRTHMQVVRHDAAGKVVETNPPSLYTARIILRGLKPGMGYDALLARMQGQLSGPPQAGIQGPAGPINRMGVRADGARRKLHVVLLALADHTGSELESAERRWQAGKCTTVRVSAAKAQVKAGASTQVTVRVSPPKGERLAAGRLDVSLSGPGTLRPSGRTRFDGGARRYTFTAPKKGWRKGAKADIRAKAISRQGVTLTGEATVGAKGAREGLHFKVTALGGSYEMRYRAPGRLPGCVVTGEHGYRLGINPKAERDKTDGSVKLSAGVGLIRLPTLRTGAETYSATCDETMGHAADPCRGRIDAPDPLDWLNITRRKDSAAITFSAPQQLWGVPPSCSLWYHDGGALANRDHPRMQTTVPWSSVTGTRPFTISVNDTQSDPNHTSTRGRTVTLQPVDKAGRALR